MEEISLSPCPCCQKRGWLEQRLRVAAAVAIVRLRQRGILLLCAEEATKTNEEHNQREQNGREKENGCPSNLYVVSLSRTARILQGLTSSSLTPGELDPAHHTSGHPRNSCLFPPLDVILSAVCHHIIDLDARISLGQSEEASSALQNLTSQLNELWPGAAGLWSRVRRVAVWFTRELLKLLLKDCELGRFPRQRQRAALLSNLACAQLLRPLLTSEILNALKYFSNIVQEIFFYENSIFLLDLLMPNELLAPLTGSSSRLLHSTLFLPSQYPLYRMYNSHIFP
uniref:uncharacterized protein isoform X2 n=1 Tax=Myxine glutinosa TaxID=7769 RepID=UPI00358E6A4F